MTDEKKTFEIEIRYDQNSMQTMEIQALAQELSARGHSVSLKKSGAGNFVEDLTKSAKDLAGLAESGYQKLRETLEPVIGTLEKYRGQQSDGFDEIGPANTTKDSTNQAIIVTSPELIDNTVSGNASRLIGLIAKTSLNRTWQPSMFDSIVIPHNAFRPYLEYIHWLPNHIFEGGYLALTENKPTLNHEDAMKRFNLTHDNGPSILIMAAGFQLA